MPNFNAGLVLGVIASAAPIVLFAHSYGPPPRVTAAPGDNARACTACHAGSALNSGSGSVKILLLSGAVYIPGVKQRVAVQVSDPAQKRWGFELSARLDSDPATGSAGDFTSVDNMTQVICLDNAPRPCASGPTFITHTSAGTRIGTPGGATFQFDWTPPATDVGPVTFYVAGNAANGDGGSTGDLIYTSTVQLKPAIPAQPAVEAGNVVNAATGVAGAMAPNSWGTIYGTNLAVTSRSWADSDLLDGGIPFSLDGVSVVLTQFGAPRLAYVGYVSPTQVNFLLPSDLNTTTTTIQVRNSAGMSTAMPLPLQAAAGQVFTLDGKRAWAVHSNGTNIGTPPATPGETIIVYGTGCGATNPGLIPGQLPVAAHGLVTLPQATIDGAAATVTAASVVPGAAGLYQLSVQVPAGAANGDLPLVFQIGTTRTAPAVIAVQK